jgi:hypothetical protein
MSRIIVTRRAALSGFGALAAAGLAGCNTTQTGAPAAAPAGGGSAPVSGYRIANIVVDAAPVVAQSGNPTGQWVQDSLPGALANVFASHMAPGDPSAGTLSVTINSVYLGGGGPGDPDRMRGVAALNGRQVNVLATSTYIANPTDQAMVEQALHGRVNALSAAFAYWLRRKLRQ